jgi:hypothetical protein
MAKCLEIDKSLCPSFYTLTRYRQVKNKDCRVNKKPPEKCQKKSFMKVLNHVFVELCFVLFSFGDGGVIARKQCETGFDG